MKIAFIISRLSEYRLLGPIIDRALAIGCRVECWHNYGQHHHGLKAYLFPSMAAAPRFRAGKPLACSYRNTTELVEWLDQGRADVVVSAGARQSDTGRVEPQGGPFWVCVQSGLDTFVNHSLAALESCDLFAAHTKWWTGWGAEYYAALNASLDGNAVRAQLEARTAYVGWTAMDTRELVDPDQVRRRWGIPSGQPVVVVLPFPQGVGRATFWPKKVFMEPSRARRLVNVLLHRQFQYWDASWRGVTDDAVMRAVRRFCDKNGAFLLVKSRHKTPIPACTRALADQCVYDETYYPPTVVEAMSISQLCVSYFSLGVLEAAGLGVPNVCVAFRAEDYQGDHANTRQYFQRFFTREEGGVYEFRGVTKTVTIEEAMLTLPNRSLDDFRLDPDARRAYLRKFIGQDDCQAASRTLDAICAAMARGPRRAAN